MKMWLYERTGEWKAVEVDWEWPDGRVEESMNEAGWKRHSSMIDYNGGLERFFLDEPIFDVWEATSDRTKAQAAAFAMAEYFVQYSTSSTSEEILVADYPAVVRLRREFAPVMLTGAIGLLLSMVHDLAKNLTGGKHPLKPSLHGRKPF